MISARRAEKRVWKQQERAKEDGTGGQSIQFNCSASAVNTLNNLMSHLDTYSSFYYTSIDFVVKTQKLPLFSLFQFSSSFFTPPLFSVWVGSGVTFILNCTRSYFLNLNCTCILVVLLGVVLIRADLSDSEWIHWYHSSNLIIAVSPAIRLKVKSTIVPHIYEWFFAKTHIVSITRSDVMQH